MKSCILYWFTRRLFAIFFLLIFSPSTNHSVVSSAICPEECSCSLYVIDCSNRLLTTVPTTNVPYNARNFVLSVNHLTIIEDDTFSELTNLQELRLTQNTIYTLKPLAFRGLNRLMELSLKNNRLVDISAIRNLPTLSLLHIESNFLQRFKPGDFHDVSLANTLTLALSNNFIAKLSSLSPPVNYLTAISTGLTIFDLHLMTHADKLRHADLSENHIRILPDLGNLTSLEKLILSGNPIHLIFSSNPPSSLYYLDIKYADLSFVPVSWVGHITYLFLDRNKFKSIHDIFHNESSDIHTLSLAENPLQDVKATPQSTDAQVSDIFTIDLRMMPNLQTLILINNKIKQLQVLHSDLLLDSMMGDHPHNLTLLFLNQNSITDMPFLRIFSRLKRLTLSHNEIQKMDWGPFDQHIRIRIIDLSNNQLSILENFTQLDALSNLDVSYNRIRMVTRGAFNGSFNLMVLKIRGNYLTRLPDLSHLPKLLYLDLSENSMDCILQEDISNLTSVLYLNVAKNDITNISIPIYKKFRYLNLQDNLLTTLNEIGNPLILNVDGSMISSFRFRNCDEQPFTSKARLSNKSSTDLRLPMTTKEFYCSYNRILSLEENSNLINRSNGQCDTSCYLNTVVLDWNMIRYIAPNVFSSCRLSSLSLAGNPIHIIPSGYVTSLSSLYLSHTNLITISLSSTFKSTSLRHLSLSNIPMFRHIPETLSFDLPELNSMLLCNNGIVNIPNMTAPFLASLNLSENNIAFLPQDVCLGIPRVYHVDLSSNRIKSISAQSFTFCIFIRELNLENNQIQHISQSAFIKQGHFILRLGNNHLVSILPSSLPLLSRTVYLDPNPWHCDCESTALRRWLLLSGVQLYQCMKPSNFRNRSLVRLRESELCPDVFGDFEPSWDISFNETNNASNSTSNEGTAASGIFYILPIIVSYLGILCIN